MGAFNDIPDNIRVPIVAIEFDNSGAVTGTPGLLYKLLVIGQMLPTASVEPLTAHRITSENQGEALFGRGSMLAEMLRYARKANSFLEVWAIGQQELAGGAAAAGSITVTAAATSAGTLALYIAGERLQIGIQAGKTPAELAAAIVAGINANTRQPLIAAVNGVDDAKVDLTCRWKGETGNTIHVQANYYVGEVLPPGLALTVVQPTGGSGNPDVGEAIAVMGDEWWNAVAMPYTDAANLAVLKQELLDRWGPLRALDGLAYASFRGTHAATGTFGNLHNNQLLTVMGCNEALTPPYLWAAVDAIVATQALNNDPARPLKTLPLPGLLPAPKEKQWTLEERNLLLYDGISTHTVDREGKVLIERQITTYQDNAAGLPDPSYLDVTTPATLGYFRYANRVRITQKFPRCKLAPDGTRYAPGQPIVTPKVVRAELLALYRELEWAGLVSNYDDYAESLLVWIDENDPNRLNVHGRPNLVNGFNIMAMKAAFIV